MFADMERAVPEDRRRAAGLDWHVYVEQSTPVLFEGVSNTHTSHRLHSESTRTSFFFAAAAWRRSHDQRSASSAKHILLSYAFSAHSRRAIMDVPSGSGDVVTYTPTCLWAVPGHILVVLMRNVFLYMNLGRMLRETAEGNRFQSRPS